MQSEGDGRAGFQALELCRWPVVAQRHRAAMYRYRRKQSETHSVLLMTLTDPPVSSCVRSVTHGCLGVVVETHTGKSVKAPGTIWTQSVLVPVPSL